MRPSTVQASSSEAGKTNVISTEHGLMNHTARLISSIAGALRGTPYHMIVTPCFPQEDPMEPVRYIVETGSADAVILNQIQPRDPRVAYLMEREFPFATHGRTVWCDRHPYFDFDNEAFARLSVTRLIERGRRNILIVAPPLSQTFAQYIVDGASAAAVVGGAEPKVLGTATTDDSNAVLCEALREWLEAHPETDGILCASAAAAMSAVAALEMQGRDLGTDIDVIAKETVPFLRLFRPALLPVAEDVNKAGTFLAKAAMQAINRPDLPPMQGLETPCAMS